MLRLPRGISRAVLSSLPMSCIATGWLPPAVASGPRGASENLAAARTLSVESCLPENSLPDLDVQVRGRGRRGSGRKPRRRSEAPLSSGAWAFAPHGLTAAVSGFAAMIALRSCSLRARSAEGRLLRGPGVLRCTAFLRRRPLHGLQHFPNRILLKYFQMCFLI